MSQKVNKRLKKFCLLFDLDYKYAQELFNTLTDKQKDHEMREMKFALNIKAEDVKMKQLKNKFKSDVKFTLNKKIRKVFEKRRKVTKK